MKWLIFPKKTFLHAYAWRILIFQMANIDAYIKYTGKALRHQASSAPQTICQDVQVKNSRAISEFIILKKQRSTISVLPVLIFLKNEVVYKG